MYKCIDCGYRFESVKEVKKCPHCKGKVVKD